MIVDKPSVLIVDDDLALLRMVEEILHREYDVTLASSGLEALALLKEDYMPQLILLDVDMPEMNGFETLERLCEVEDACDVPIVFLTGMGYAEAELQGLSLGAVDYVVKPFVKDILLARLRVHIENGRRLRLASMQEKSRQGRIDEAKLDALSEDLNDTEKRVLRFVALGYTNQEIAEELNYSYGYVKNVVYSVLHRIKFSSRKEVRRYLT